MSLRKIAGLLLAGSLSLALIGGGVAATWSVSGGTAAETVNVGIMACTITDATPGASGIGTPTVTYTAPLITKSAPDSAPFWFIVSNTGNVPLKASAVGVVVASPALAPFSDIGVTPGATTLTNYGDWVKFNAGLSWTDLTGFMGATATVTYTVTCTEP